MALGIFDKIEDPKKRNDIMGSIAVIHDCMQDAYDFIEVDKLKNPYPCNDKRHLERFANVFRNAIGAQRSRWEDFTIQVKCVSQHEHTQKHKDDLNCTRKGWTKTVALCVTQMDSAGNLWSIKFIGNSRDKAGRWESNVYKLTPMMTRIKSQMQAANNFFQTLALHQSENGGHNYHHGLTAATHRNLVLDDSCPWIEENIGNSGKFSFIAKRMLIPALPVRDVHLSGPATVGYHLQQMTGDERRMVEILLMAGYASGWSRFYHLCMQNLDELANPNKRPLLVFYDLAMKHFGIAFGDTKMGWISPSNIDYPAVYLDKDGNVSSVMDNVVDSILGVLKWINETAGTDNFHHANMKKKFQGT